MCIWGYRLEIVIELLFNVGIWGFIGYFKWVFIEWEREWLENMWIAQIYSVLTWILKWD